jgi:hypothetical protein
MRKNTSAYPGRLLGRPPLNKLLCWLGSLWALVEEPVSPDQLPGLLQLLSPGRCRDSTDVPVDGLAAHAEDGVASRSASASTRMPNAS